MKAEEAKRLTQLKKENAAQKAFARVPAVGVNP